MIYAQEIERGENKTGLLFTVNRGKYSLFTVSSVLLFFFYLFYSQALSLELLWQYWSSFSSLDLQNLSKMEKKIKQTSRSLINLSIIPSFTLQRNISSSEHELYYHHNFRHSFPLILLFQQSLEEYHSCCCPYHRSRLHLQSIYFHWVIFIVL